MGWWTLEASSSIRLIFGWKEPKFFSDEVSIKVWWKWYKISPTHPHIHTWQFMWWVWWLPNSLINTGGLPNRQMSFPGCVCMWVELWMCVRVCMYVYLCVCLEVWLCLCVCVCVCEWCLFVSLVVGRWVGGLGFEWATSYLVLWLRLYTQTTSATGTWHYENQCNFS